jgi:uncharacterized protein YgbK (DUF1537 family)
MLISCAAHDQPKTRLAALYPEHIYLLADDLTGACDAAAAFLPYGHRVRIWFGGKALSSASETVQAFNTDSRALPAEQAAAAVQLASAALVSVDKAFIFKKIDSAARGPLGAELLAAQKAFGAQAILLAPSFPETGRTVRNGVLHVEDAPGLQMEVALAALFPPESQTAITLVAHPDDLAAALRSGRSVLVCDASTQSELEALVRKAESQPHLLYAGSAGLAKAIASRYPASAQQRPLPQAARTLIVVGTQHPVTLLQLDHLTAHHPGANVLRIRCKDGDGERIRETFREIDPQALILTGGTTAQLAVLALGAESMILHGEFAPGIPWGTLVGGVADGRVICTKSGGFGTQTALHEILNSLSGLFL